VSGARRACQRPCPCAIAALFEESGAAPSAVGGRRPDKTIKILIFASGFLRSSELVGDNGFLPTETQ